jgi:hypothetical protein
VAQSAEALLPGWPAADSEANELLEVVPDATSDPANSQLIPEYLPEDSPPSPFAGALVDRPNLTGN